MKLTDLADARFGRLRVLERAPSRRMPSGGTKACWVCLCDCGEIRVVIAASLISGRSESCGCLQREVVTGLKTTHGERHTKLYGVWTQMLQRCGNEKNRSFARYGGRGIMVCKRWRSFEAFKADMGGDYVDGLQIDRDDNNGHYEKRNCRWVTGLVNSRNQQKTICVEWEGKTVPLAELADRYGVKHGTAYSRFRLKHWPIKRALGLE